MASSIKHFAPSMFIGQTTGGVPTPVWFDEHMPLFNNKPPATLVTGSPGNGKTFFALTRIALSAMMGKTVVCLDPKGDALGLSELQEKYLGRISVWALGSNTRGKAGLMDPFSMTSDKGETLSLVIDVIDLFVGGLSDGERTVLSPIIKDVINFDIPSLTRVVDVLKSSEKDMANDLGTKLDLIQNLPIARICFDSGLKRRKKISIDKGLTIITLAGLTLPKSEAEARNTNNGRLVSGLLFLVTDFIQRVMEADTSQNPKTLVIDEAWAVLASEQGKTVIEKTSLLGRSKKLALILITQSTAHLKNLDIENTISTRFAFGTSRKDAERIIQDMRLPLGEKFEDILPELSTGECLMQDWLDRYCTMQVADWNREWHEAFESNPLDREMKKREQARARKQN